MSKWEELRPRVEARRSWGLYRPQHVWVDIQCEVSFLGICWIGLEVVIFKNPFGYDTFFGLLGYGICISNDDTCW